MLVFLVFLMVSFLVDYVHACSPPPPIPLIDSTCPAHLILFELDILIVLGR
jgi:hypothetical protein